MLVLPVAAAEFLLLVVTSNRYGYHRDELYFRVAARHPAWGYDDQPALTPLVGRFSEWMFGADPRGLRMLSAVAMALVVVLVALIARELGVAECTVVKHLEHVYARIGAHNRAEALRLCATALSHPFDEVETAAWGYVAPERCRPAPEELRHD